MRYPMVIPTVTTNTIAMVDVDLCTCAWRILDDLAIVDAHFMADLAIFASKGAMDTGASVA